MKNKLITILILIIIFFMFSGKKEQSIDVPSKRALRLTIQLNARMDKIDLDIIYLARRLSEEEIIRRAQETITAPVPAPAFLLPSQPLNLSNSLCFVAKISNKKI